jgi:hypothetical protein
MDQFEQEGQLEKVKLVNLIEAKQQVFFGNLYPGFASLEVSVQCLKYFDAVMSSA